MRKKGFHTAVVLGADVNGLGHIRSLGRMGIFTYVICSGTGISNIARFSKYCTPVMVRSCKKNYASELKAKLVELGKRIGKKTVLYATSDYFVSFIDLNRDTLSKYFLFNIPESNVLSLVTNKYNTAEIAVIAGVLSPKTVHFIDCKMLTNISSTISFPCIVKPQNSYEYSFPGKNLIVNNSRELIAFLNRHPSVSKHIILQEIIPGSEINIFQCTAYVGKTGAIQMFTMQKYHQTPPGYGNNSLGRSITVPSLMMATKKLLKNLEYTGFASIEYKISEKNSQYYFIEINPRLPWYNSLFDTCGINFSYLAYHDLKEEAHPNQSSSYLKQKDNIYWIALKNELSGLINRIEEDLTFNFRETLRNILRARSFAYFDKDDLKPYLMSNIEFMKMVLRKIFK